jgi:hypothetical protein
MKIYHLGQYFGAFNHAFPFIAKLTKGKLFRVKSMAWQTSFPPDLMFMMPF